MKRLAVVLLPLVLVGCAGSNGDAYDEALLNTYRQAVPAPEALAMTAPTASADRALQSVGEPAYFPQIVVPTAQNINQAIAGTLKALHTVIQTPPTAWNRKTLEFVWGPFANEDSAQEGDSVLVYIRDNGADSDFRYSYAFARGMGSDRSTFQPVIWGGQNPVAGDTLGQGVVLYDYEANYAWEEANNPEHGTLDRGRFASTYGTQPQGSAQLTFVVAVFRDWVPVGSTSSGDDLDYFYGKVEQGENRFDFADFQFQTNFGDTDPSVLEDFGIQAAFYNTGVGRAEADASNGDLTTELPGYYAAVDECWDAALNRTYLQLSKVPLDPESTESAEELGSEGSPAGCAIESLEDVPSLDDVSPDVLNALENVALSGISSGQ